MWSGGSERNIWLPLVGRADVGLSSAGALLEPDDSAESGLYLVPSVDEMWETPSYI